jgi:hypothetical protein
MYHSFSYSLFNERQHQGKIVGHELTKNYAAASPSDV